MPNVELHQEVINTIREVLDREEKALTGKINYRSNILLDVKLDDLDREWHQKHLDSLYFQLLRIQTAQLDLLTNRAG